MSWAVLLCRGTALTGLTLGMPAFKHWETEMHEAGVAALLSVQRRHLSLVDCVSFDVIHRHGLSRAFAFDPHFAEQGFDCVPSIGKELVA